ncbi:hypothetical protein Bca101_044485 [Brassica carinata]
MQYSQMSLKCKTGEEEWFCLGRKNLFASTSSKFFETDVVSFVQKYIMRKLDLQTEDEVEIRCMGEAVTPALKLHRLVDLWLQRSSKRQRVDASVGSSAKDYMMVLVYVRKLLECND